MNRLVALLVTLLLASGFSAAQDAETAVEIREPIMITSAGQGADATVLNALLRRAKVTAELNETITAGELEDINTLLLVLGGSQKALGAAGISVPEELSRLDELLTAAEEAGIIIIGLHIGGEGRRGPLSEPFIAATAGRTHTLIVTAEGNKDKYFDTLSEAEGIPLILIDRTSDVTAVIVDMVAD